MTGNADFTHTVGCQSRTVRSFDPDAIRAVVGEKSTEYTGPWGRQQERGSEEHAREE